MTDRMMDTLREHWPIAADRMQEQQDHIDALEAELKIWREDSAAAWDACEIRRKQRRAVEAERDELVAVCRKYKAIMLKEDQETLTKLED